MSDDFPQERFSTSEDLLKRLQERSDDFESVKVMVVNDLPVAGPQTQKRLLTNCCCIIKTCSGESIVMHREDFQILQNDGILQRLKIPISLIPLESR